MAKKAKKQEKKIPQEIEVIKTPITKDQFISVCELIESTPNSISSICLMIKPTISKQSFYDYMRIVGDEAKDRYARAKEIQCNIIADDMYDIADDGSNDLMTIIKGNEDYEIENKEVTNRSRLRIDTRKWLLSKLLPKKFGEKIDLSTNGESLNKQPIIQVATQKDAENIQEVIERINKNASLPTD